MMGVLSPMTTMAADPIMEQAWARESKSIGVPSSSALSRGADKPPGMTALIDTPSGGPPA